MSTLDDRASAAIMELCEEHGPQAFSSITVDNARHRIIGEMLDSMQAEIDDLKAKLTERETDE